MMIFVNILNLIDSQTVSTHEAKNYFGDFEKIPTFSIIIFRVF